MFCTNCGNKIENDSKFCSNCGVEKNIMNVNDDIQNKNAFNVIKVASLISAIFGAITLFYTIWLILAFSGTKYTFFGLITMVYPLLIISGVINVVLLIFNIKNVIKVNKISVIVISIIEILGDLLSRNFLFLALPIVKLVYAFKIK